MILSGELRLPYGETGDTEYLFIERLGEVLRFTVRDHNGNILRYLDQEYEDVMITIGALK